MRSFSILALACILASSFGFGQDPTSADPSLATATCNFSEQQQLAVEYRPLTVEKKQEKNFLGHEVPYGKIWAPEERALTMFTNSPVSIAGANLPVGAYTLYLIPARKQWTLVVSKNTDVKATYDESKDLVRAPMEIGQLPAPEQKFSIYFAHTGPNECTMQVDIADTRAWVPFQQK